MSFCYDCSDRGYDMCFCKPIKQPNIKFVSEIDTIKKLQEQNKIMREALELISATDTSSFAPDLLWHSNWRNNTKERAREALAKVKE